MLRIYKSALAILLAGGVIPPAMAASSEWRFGESVYSVRQTGSLVDVQLTRNKDADQRVLKAECRSALSIPLRVKYQSALINKGLIDSVAWQDWPLASVDFSLESIKYGQTTANSTTCSADVIDGAASTNLNKTAMRYALFHADRKSWDDAIKLASYLLKQPSEANDAAGVVTLMLIDKHTVQAQTYFSRYVEPSSISYDELRLPIGKWLFDSGLEQESLAMLVPCKKNECQNLVLTIEEKTMAENADRVDDLSAYF